ncbi:MAG: ABC transporter permease [Gemmatimonadota bacterium]|jgi:predicted permease
MSKIMGWGDRLRALFAREKVEREMEEELRFHLEMETRKNVAAGMDPLEARRQARIAFGGVDRFAEKTREERGVRPLEDLFTDTRFALRTLRKSPGFALVAILSLAVGIGANTTIYSVVNAILLRDLPFEAPEQLVNLYRDRAQGSFDPMSYPDYRVIRDATAGVFQGLEGHQYAMVQRGIGSGPETLIAEMVTGGYMPLLGVGAALGRIILPEDHVAPGSHPVVVLGYRYWERAFAGDPEVLGRSIRISGRAYTIVGVAPRSFLGSTRGIVSDLFVPIMMVGDLMPLERDPLESRGSNAFFPVGRVRSDVLEAQVEAALALARADLQEIVPDFWRPGENLVAVPTQDVVFHPAADQMVRSANIVGMVLVGLVLLIACTNLTSFLLARSVDRRREVAIRMALGAPRRRILGQLLTETVLLGLLAGVAGFVLALWALDFLMGLTMPTPIPLGVDLSFDWKTPVFTLLVALGVGVLVGLVPALQATRPDLAPALKEGERSSKGRPAFLLGRILVAGQMAVSLILLVAAALFIRSFQYSLRTDPGFGLEPTALLSFMVPSGDYSNEEGLMLIRTIRERVSRLPDVIQVGVISNIHLNTVNRMMLEVNADGVAPPAGRSAHQVDFTSVDEGFFSAAGISLLQGRTFGEEDRADGLPVVVVNQALARRFWPEGQVLGRTIRVEVPGWPEVTVVGVVETAKIRTLGEPPTPFIYFPYAQEYNAWVTLLAVTRRDPGATADELFRLVRSEHPDLIVTASTTMEAHVGTMLILRRLSAMLSVLFACVAVSLAVTGLYGVVRHNVVRGAREMGIRMSLGASKGSVVAFQLRRGLSLVLVGSIVGVLLSAFAAQALSPLLLGVDPRDPLTYCAVAAILGLVALIAAYIPARRASRADPVQVLKAE